MSNLAEETMPLSKARDRERKKQVRLDARVRRGMSNLSNLVSNLVSNLNNTADYLFV